jgi:peptidoglycan L-alanyl-D-glutamate endopeptidase CwlK
MPKFSQKSLERLNTCDPRLVEIFEEVIKHYDCTIICGVRSKEEQDEAFRTGKSKLRWPNSLHNVSSPDKKSRAVDVAPCPIDWTNYKAFYHFAGFVKGIAASKGIELRWGGDWDSDFDFKDQNFNDLPHFELVG